MSAEKQLFFTKEEVRCPSEERRRSGRVGHQHGEYRKRCPRRRSPIRCLPQNRSRLGVVGDWRGNLINIPHLGPWIMMYAPQIAAAKAKTADQIGCPLSLTLPP